MKKKRAVQLSIDFTVDVNQFESNVHHYYHQFAAIAKTLWQEKRSGKNPTGGFSCEAWWQSRYSDFLTNLNSKHKDHEEWQYRQLGFKLWSEIWQQFQSNFITGKF